MSGHKVMYEISKHFLIIFHSLSFLFESNDIKNHIKCTYTKVLRWRYYIIYDGKLLYFNYFFSVTRCSYTFGKRQATIGKQVCHLLPWGTMGMNHNSFELPHPHVGRRSEIVIFYLMQRYSIISEFEPMKFCTRNLGTKCIVLRLSPSSTCLRKTLGRYFIVIMF